MILFQTVCRGNHKSAWGVFALFSGLAVLAFLAMYFEIGRLIIAQVILLISLIVASYVEIRFIGTAFIYQALREEDGDFLLISRRQGRRSVAQCKLALSCLKWIEAVDTRLAPAPQVEGVPVSNYSAYLFADSYTLALFDDGVSSVLIRINADEAFLSALAAYLPKEKEDEAVEELQA